MQQLRCAYGTGAQNHSLTRDRLHLFFAVPHFSAGASEAVIRLCVYVQFGHLRGGPHLEIWPRITSRPQKRFGRVPAPTAFLVHFEIADAFVRTPVEVVGGGNTGLHRGLRERVQHVPAQALFLNPPFAACVAVPQGLVVHALALLHHFRRRAFGTVQSIRAEVMVFVHFEIRQAVFPAPARVAGDGRPLVVVARLAAHVNHAVDAGAAAQHLAARVAQAAAVQTVGGFGLVQPVGARIAYAIQIADRNMHPVVIVFAPGFDQQHPLGSVGAQTVGQQATGGAGTNDDVVEGGVVHVIWKSA